MLLLLSVYLPLNFSWLILRVHMSWVFSLYENFLKLSIEKMYQDNSYSFIVLAIPFLFFSQRQKYGLMQSEISLLFHSWFDLDLLFYLILLTNVCFIHSSFFLQEEFFQECKFGS